MYHESLRCSLGIHSWKYSFEHDDEIGVSRINVLYGSSTYHVGYPKFKAYISQDEANKFYGFSQYWLLPEQRNQESNKYIDIYYVNIHFNGFEPRFLWLHININNGKLYKKVRICERCSKKTQLSSNGGWDVCELTKADIREIKLKELLNK